LDDPEIVPVVSLAVLRPGDPALALFGVRSATLTSSRHPNVLSSPTMRVPAAVMRAALSSLGMACFQPETGEIRLLSGCPTAPIGCAGSMGDVTAFLVESVLMRKLGLAGPLVTGRVTGRATAKALALDRVADPLGGGPEELTLMLSILLELDSGAEEFPVSTESYLRLDWVDIERIRDAVDSHDALQLVPDADPFTVCLQGLCVRSTAEMVERLGESSRR